VRQTSPILCAAGARQKNMKKSFINIILSDKSSSNSIKLVHTGALVAAKKAIPVIHVEAGLRSFDRGMPEETKRVQTDQLSDLLFITEPTARGNLLCEGVPCITLRDTTERPITVDQDTNTVVGHDSKQIMAIVSNVLSNGGKRGRTAELWDGRAAVRIKSVLTDWLQQRTATLSKAKFQ
jgi:UDP-N-acetylglucosamine 2-epimerase